MCTKYHGVVPIVKINENATPATDDVTISGYFLDKHG